MSEAGSANPDTFGAFEEPQKQGVDSRETNSKQNFETKVEKNLIEDQPEQDEGFGNFEDDTPD